VDLELSCSWQRGNVKSKESFDRTTRIRGKVSEENRKIGRKKVKFNEACCSKERGVMAGQWTAQLQLGEMGIPGKEKLAMSLAFASQPVSGRGNFRFMPCEIVQWYRGVWGLPKNMGESRGGKDTQEP